MNNLLKIIRLVVFLPLILIGAIFFLVIGALTWDKNFLEELQSLFWPE